MKTKSKKILITGASTGIGYDLVKVFVENGYEVIGTVRKQEDADRLTKELGDKFSSVLFDVTDHDAIEKAAEKIESELGNEGLGGLINNAGIAVGGPFTDITIEEFRYQFEVNVFGMIKVSQAFMRLLGAREAHANAPGKIIQISSIAGKGGMPFMGPYTGSKYAMEGISECMRKELLLYGIDVVIIEPGPIKTPIWNKGASELVEDKFKDSVFFPALKKYQKKFIYPAVQNAWTSEKAARIIFKGFEKKQSKTRYLIVPQKFKNWTLPRMLPPRLLDRILGKAIGLIK